MKKHNKYVIIYKNDVDIALFGPALRVKDVIEINSEKSKIAKSKIEEAHIYRETLLQAVNKAAGFLLSSNFISFGNALFQAMGVMAEAVKVDRVFVWENHMHDGELCCTQVYEWSVEAEPQQGKAIAVNAKYSEVMPPEWFERISGGKSINGIVREMPRELQDQLTPQGIVSILLVPIFMDDIFWGFIGFDDCHNERLFTADEEAILRSCGLLFANAIARDEMVKNVYETSIQIEHRDNLLNAVNQMAILLLNSDTESFEDGLYESMQLIADAMNVDCVYLWENQTIDGVLCCAQIFEWSIDEAVFDKGVFYKYGEVVPGWEETLSGGECINSIVREMSAPEQAHLSPWGILSILIVPVFAENQFWGFVGFDDYHRERIFAKEEVAILKSASLLIANSFINNNMVKNIRDTSARLELALTQANAASKAKSDFLSTMSHEIRTPMNAIIGSTAIGIKAARIEEKDQALRMIDDAASHLLGVISDILDMAKIEADKMELIPVKYCFEKMLQKVVSLNRFNLDKKQQTLSVDIDKEIPAWVIGDEQRITQAITNLLSNAIKFTHKGGSIHLAAALIGECEDFCKLQIQVIDSGIGIPPERQDKLFDAFEQVDNEYRHMYGGTGLGLPITKRIVEMMGGRIQIDSELGKGTKVTLTVQAERAPKVNTEECTEMHNTSQQDAADIDLLKNKRLLIVEDMEVNREILVMLLADSGLLIDCAENGKEAVDMIAADPEKYDIVLMDMQMPIMNGLEATKHIRALHRDKRLPIIALTANVFKDNIEDCLAAGMDDHIGKPVDIDRVFEKLLKHLAG